MRSAQSIEKYGVGTIICWMLDAAAQGNWSQTEGINNKNDTKKETSCRERERKKELLNGNWIQLKLIYAAQIACIWVVYALCVFLLLLFDSSSAFVGVIIIIIANITYTRIACTVWNTRSRQCGWLALLLWQIESPQCAITYNNINEVVHNIFASLILFPFRFYLSLRRCCRFSIIRSRCGFPVFWCFKKIDSPCWRHAWGAGKRTPKTRISHFEYYK